MRGRLLFNGYLALDTAGRIAQALRELLTDRTYVFVTVNEAFGWRPEVRTGLTLREPVDTHRFGEVEPIVDVRFNDEVYVCSVMSKACTEREARQLPDDSLDKVRVTIYSTEAQFEHRAPAGHRLFWTLAPTDLVFTGV